MSPITYDELKIGDKGTFEKTISETDVYTFAGVTGDLNPAHISKSYAEKTFFKERIAHGMLVGSMFSTVFGTRMPGEGTIYVSQSLNFLAPVLFGDTITVTVQVKEKLEKGRVLFDCTAVNQNNKVVVSGEAVLMPPRSA